MRKFLLATVAAIAAALGIAQAAVISVVNPALPTQPPPTMQPATPALSPAFTQHPFPFLDHPAPAASSPPNLTGAAPSAGVAKQDRR